MNENDMIACDACSDHIDSDDAHVTYDDRHICSDCVRVCERCDMVGEEMDDWNIVNGHELWCQLCTENHAYYCDGCNEYGTDYVTYTSDSGLSYCDGCDGHLTHCEECDEYYEGTCDYHDMSDEVHNYSYRPDPVFHTTSDSERLFFGFELEMEFNGSSVLREAAQYASHKLEGSAYLKEDGSLDTGFELVTHPMSFDYLMTEADDLWNVVEELNKTYGARSYNTSTCGFHIHISRSGFNGGAHMHRFLNLVYSNEFLFSKLAGRKSDRWAKFDDVRQVRNVLVENEDGSTSWKRVDLGRSFKDKLQVGRETDRYSAVNTQNRETLELRIFKGTLSQTALAAHIQLAHAAVEYTRTLSVLDIRNGALSAENFIGYILSKDYYNDLVQRIEHKQLVTVYMPMSKPVPDVPADEVDRLIRRSDELERAEYERRQAEWEAQRARQREEMQRALDMALEREQANESFTAEYITAPATDTLSYAPRMDSPRLTTSMIREAAEQLRAEIRQTQATGGTINQDGSVTFHRVQE